MTSLTIRVSNQQTTINQPDLQQLIRKIEQEISRQTFHSQSQIFPTLATEQTRKLRSTEKLEHYQLMHFLCKLLLTNSRAVAFTNYLNEYLGKLATAHRLEVLDW